MLTMRLEISYAPVHFKDFFFYSTIINIYSILIKFQQFQFRKIELLSFNKKNFPQLLEIFEGNYNLYFPIFSISCHYKIMKIL